MEASRNLLPTSPLFLLPRAHLRNYSTHSSSSSVPILCEQATPAVTSVPTTSMSCYFPMSVLLQEQRDDFRSSLHIIREDKTSQATLDRRLLGNRALFHDEKKNSVSDQDLEDFERQLLNSPDLCCPWANNKCRLPSLYKGEKPFLSLPMQSVTAHAGRVVDVKPCDVLALAKEAVLASKQAASIAQDYQLLGADLNERLFASLGPTKSADLIPVEEEVMVKSTRRLERRSKKRKVLKLKFVDSSASNLKKADKQKKIREVLDSNDPLQLFLSGPEKNQLLTVKEEAELFVEVQELLRLEEVKQRLQSQFERQPTLVEWAEAVGMSCQVLQSHIISGNRSREKMIFANLRMVVHVAKKYQGRGLSLQDLLQVGSMGLMKSLEKFIPQAGCRFSTYAYWWIRHSIMKAIFQNSRTIRLPENVYNLLNQVKKAKNICIREGYNPTNEQLAKHVGITVQKLERLLLSTRRPLSMQQQVWTDQDTTFQEVTADPKVEIPDLCVAKQLMSQHVRNLLSILPYKERRIIQMRYGIADGKQKSLAEIGSIFNLSKERVRQLEKRALDKLKQCLSSQGLGAYADLLI
ncbi:RNA polymerase sigma factor sigF, chloroplastic isoform X2 [Telopea speciosissima]|uniref:RNA polymerase sigma factor sigF, chloroplastic isoform X2 n=1 Tax=Telopea speciosissima TaxID=54955 RepID=UPI001CC6D0D0|nr:RNA polymerase sigma factor sigF, chloroplastic isoform X2 [Telopea speciosissima]